jgi:CxxC motif-containing protein (DUF1111 family)
VCGIGTFLAALSSIPITQAQITGERDSAVRDPGVRGGPPAAGEPLPGLTTGQRNFFVEGKDAFEETNFVKDPPPGGDPGLGPRFNSDSCGSCHAQPAIGGSSPAVNPQIEVATKLGAINKIPWFLSQDGPVREVRFVRRPDGSPDGGVHALFVIAGRSDAPRCNIAQEDFSNRSNLAFRIPTPVFGGGLIEAVPDYLIEENLRNDSAQKGSLGITGRLNRSGNDGTITRFGHKAQVKSLHEFSAEAYNVEQGVTNNMFPHERDETRNCSYNQTPEDSVDFETGGVDDIALFAAFMRFLAPPTPAPSNTDIADGFNAFRSVGCHLCHSPSLRTGDHSVAALRNKNVPLYSDLALHAMGPGLADGIAQGHAAGDEFRTAPLWGLGKRIFFLHDGRSKDLVEAILAHKSRSDGRYRDSEANQIVDRFRALPDSSKRKLLVFLRSL